MKLSNVLVAAASLLAAPTLAGNLKPDYVMEEACTPGREDTRSCYSRTANGQTLTLIVECKHKEWTVVDDCFFKPCIDSPVRQAHCGKDTEPIGDDYIVHEDD